MCAKTFLWVTSLSSKHSINMPITSWKERLTSKTNDFKEAEGTHTRARYMHTHTWANFRSVAQHRRLLHSCCGVLLGPFAWLTRQRQVMFPLSRSIKHHKKCAPGCVNDLKACFARGGALVCPCRAVHFCRCTVIISWSDLDIMHTWGINLIWDVSPC